jgi:hypothetical protein
MTVKDRESSFQTGAQLISASPHAEWSKRRAGPVPPVQTWTCFPEIMRSVGCGFMVSFIPKTAVGHIMHKIHIEKQILMSKKILTHLVRFFIAGTI